MSGTELALIEVQGTALFASPAKVDEVIDEVRRRVRAIETDVTSEAGRRQIASVAYHVARSKTYLDGLGKDLVAELKQQTSAIDRDRKRIRDEMDALKAEVRAPLDEFEARERERVAAHEHAIFVTEQLGTFFEQPPGSGAVRDRIGALERMPPRDWQEFEDRAVAAIGSVSKRLGEMLKDAETREAEQAELRRLRAEEDARQLKAAEEQAKRERAERDLRIAEAAKLQAEQAAHAEAQRERVEAAQRHQAELRQAAEQHAAAAMDAVKREDQQRAAAEAAKLQAEADAAEIKRLRDLADVEIGRINAVSRERKAEVHNEVVSVLQEAGLHLTYAKKVVTMIVNGKIPHVTITYA